MQSLTDLRCNGNHDASRQQVYQFKPQLRNEYVPMYRNNIYLLEHTTDKKEK